eukprot:TRINITY_DN543_c1_g3_i1.p2 TRINITY_DN543_c1_g3~~TRINITY_DN543_c1_g3_i1.p2  ORF type:complete len:155 (+),score=30.32 TRINITY_DN543_c1_g3_i1:109-573(+)
MSGPPGHYHPPHFNSVVCTGCSTTLAYPQGAPSVRCPICETVTPAQAPEIRLQCIRCQTPLILPLGTTLALCPICRLVMRVPPRMPQHMPNGQQQPQQPPQQPVEARCMVYVENPPTMVNGKMVSSVSVGTKLSDTPAPPAGEADVPPPPPEAS